MQLTSVKLFQPPWLTISDVAPSLIGLASGSWLLARVSSGDVAALAPGDRLASALACSGPCSGDWRMALAGLGEVGSGLGRDDLHGLPNCIPGQTTREVLCSCVLNGDSPQRWCDSSGRALPGSVLYHIPWAVGLATRYTGFLTDVLRDNFAQSGS